MGPRRQQILVAALVLVLAVAGYRTWRQTSPEAVPSSNGRGRVGRTSDNAKQMPAAPDVHLDALQAERPQPHGHERDLFRFKPKAPPPAPPRPVQTNPQPIAPTQPSGPPAPPTPPPRPPHRRRTPPPPPPSAPTAAAGPAAAAADYAEVPRLRDGAGQV